MSRASVDSHEHTPIFHRSPEKEVKQDEAPRLSEVHPESVQTTGVRTLSWPRTCHPSNFLTRRMESDIRDWCGFRPCCQGQHGGRQSGRLSRVLFQLIARRRHCALCIDSPPSMSRTGTKRRTAHRASIATSSPGMVQSFNVSVASTTAGKNTLSQIFIAIWQTPQPVGLFCGCGPLELEDCISVRKKTDCT